jgi:hypothetical protein
MECPNCGEVLEFDVVDDDEDEPSGSEDADTDDQE